MILTEPVWYRQQTHTQTPQCENLKSSLLIWTSQVRHLEPFHSSFRSSINCTATVCDNKVQLCRCHHQMIICCWKRTQHSTRNHQKPSLHSVRSCWKIGVRVQSQVCQPELRGCCADRTSWYRHRTLKLDWSVLLITWTEKKHSGGKRIRPQSASICLEERRWSLHHREHHTKMFYCGAVLLPVDLLL